MISPTFAVKRRTLPIILFVALPQFGFLRALLVRPCNFGAFGTHDPFCYLTLSWTAIAGQVLSVVFISIPVGILLDRTLVQRLASQVRWGSPVWLTSPSNSTLAVSAALFFGLGLLTVFDPRLSVWWSFDTETVVGTVESVTLWGLYVPSVGVAFGGNYFVAVLRGMVGVTALPVRLLFLGLMLVSSVLQIVWLYAVAAALIGCLRRARIALASEEPLA